jgi:hypothetical protein
VGVVRPRQSLINLSPPRSGSDGNGEEPRFGDIELSKVDVTVDLEQGDVATVSMVRTKSPSPPPSRIFEVQNVDLGV